MIFFSNHDMPRFFMEAGQDADWYKNAMVFLATTRGIPQLYQGDEILQTHHEGDDHGNIRRDFPGGWDRVFSGSHGFSGYQGCVFHQSGWVESGEAFPGEGNQPCSLQPGISILRSIPFQFNNTHPC